MMLFFELSSNLKEVKIGMAIYHNYKKNGIIRPKLPLPIDIYNKTQNCRSCVDVKRNLHDTVYLQ